MSLLGIALMAEVWPARESTGVILPMLIFGDFFAVRLFNKHALWPEVWRIMPPAFLGVIIGFEIFTLLPGAVFAPVIGWIVLVLVGLQLWRRSAAASRSLAKLSGEVKHHLAKIKAMETLDVSPCDGRLEPWPEPQQCSPTQQDR